MSASSSARPRLRPAVLSNEQPCRVSCTDMQSEGVAPEKAEASKSCFLSSLFLGRDPVRDFSSRYRQRPIRWTFEFCACPCRPACHDPRTIVRLPSTFLVWLVWHTCTAGLQECMLDLLCIEKDDGAQVRIYGYMRRGKRCCCTICAGCVEPSSNMVKEMVLFWDKEFS